MTLCVSGIVRAVHQSSSKLGDTPLARLDLFESLPSRRFGCRASTTNSTAKSRSTSLYNAGASSRGGCRALQLYSAPERSTSLQLYSALHSTSSTPSLRLWATGLRHRARDGPPWPCGPSQRAWRGCTECREHSGQAPVERRAMLARRGRRARRPAQSVAEPGVPARTPAAAGMEAKLPGVYGKRSHAKRHLAARET